MSRDGITGAALLGLVVSSATLAQSESAFYRILAPTDTVITAMGDDGTMVWTSSAAGVTARVQRSSSLSVESNWTDYIEYPQTDTVARLRVLDPNPPADMVLIPAGTFQMGDPFAEGWTDERPVRTVYVSAFYMAKYEVTVEKWNEVFSWAGTNGYSFSATELPGKAPTHPAHSINWFDIVKWCNARSQREGLTPVYYANAALTEIYNKTIGFAPPYVNGSANGYRLPTEAEWEKAARGGVSGHRFPWADTDTIDHSRANYNSTTNRAYDVSETRGYHPFYNDGAMPYTSPVGSFRPNGYGLYDMSGNVWEWCWDWHGTYAAGPQTDPVGATSGVTRVSRGGGWDNLAYSTRCAERSDGCFPTSAWSDGGFRCARRP